MGNESIEVRVTRGEMQRYSGIDLSVYGLAKCKAAGMPLKGVFFFRGVERGTLERADDYETGDIVLRWKP